MVGAALVALASSDPKTEMMDPGATGAGAAANLAPFTTPPASIRGAADANRPQQRAADRARTRVFVPGTLSPNLNGDFVGCLAIHREDQFHDSAPGEAARDTNVYLVEPGEVRIGAGVENF